VPVGSDELVLLVSPSHELAGRRQVRAGVDRSVRLAAEDLRRLQERATARGLASATYVSLLVRSHLSGSAPLPKAEYLALRQSVLELTAIGRNMNQIAKALNQGGNAVPPGRSEVAAMLRVAQRLRDHTKELLSANEVSWAHHAKMVR